MVTIVFVVLMCRPYLGSTHCKKLLLKYVVLAISESAVFLGIENSMVDILRMQMTGQLN